MVLKYLHRVFQNCLKEVEVVVVVVVGGWGVNGDRWGFCVGAEGEGSVNSFFRWCFLSHFYHWGSWGCWRLLALQEESVLEGAFLERLSH